MVFHLVARIDFARAADLGEEGAGVGDAVRVHAEGAHADHVEILVADGDRLRRAPLAASLHARAEVIHVRLEWRVEQLVPVFQVGQQRQGLRRQLVRAGTEDVGDLAFIDEDGDLRFAHIQDGAVLDLEILHGEAPGQHAFRLFVPLQYVDKLLLDKAAEAHDECP
ncbi:hypothetical protein D3C72_1116160 [compost metagenome]